MGNITTLIDISYQEYSFGLRISYCQIGLVDWSPKKSFTKQNSAGAASKQVYKISRPDMPGNFSYASHYYILKNSTMLSSSFQCHDKNFDPIEFLRPETLHFVTSSDGT